MHFLPVVGYEGLYEVSDTGVVRGVAKTVKGNHRKATRNIPPRDKKQSLLLGYPAVTLFKGEGPKMIKVHRLVAEAFIPNPCNYDQINHIDGDKTNNHVANLEWCTSSHNNYHRHEMIRKRKQSGVQASKGEECLACQ